MLHSHAVETGLPSLKRQCMRQLYHIICLFLLVPTKQSHFVTLVSKIASGFYLCISNLLGKALVLFNCHI